MAELHNTAARVDHTAHVEHQDQGSAGMPQLNPDTFASQLFWLVAIFTALYMVMSRQVIPRIRTVMEKRQSQISHDLDTAQKAQEEAQKAKEEYEKEMVSARSKAASLILETQQQIERNYVQTHHKLDLKLASQLAEAEGKIAEHAAEVQKEVTPVIEELTSAIVEELVKVKPAPKKVQDAVKSAMEG